MVKRSLLFCCVGFVVFAGSLFSAEPADEEPLTSSHNLKVGAIATNTYYVDKTIVRGLFSGFYRPYLKYTYDRRIETLVRGNMTVKRYIEAPTNGMQQTSVSGAMEIFSVDATFGNHKFNVGRNFFMTEQGILFANFADGVAYTGSFSFGTLRGMGLYSADYGTKNCALSVTGCAGDTNAFVSTPTLSADSGVQNWPEGICRCRLYIPRFFGRAIVCVFSGFERPDQRADIEYDALRV
ncbi:MAG: hypothetical protein U1F27_15325 [Turneriella sp.]